MSDFGINDKRTGNVDLWQVAEMKKNNEQTQKNKDCDKIGQFLNGSMSGAYMT